jgi:hypothetical protein
MKHEERSMPTLTAYQIQLARDIETIQEALAAGFVIPDEPPAPEPAATPKEDPQPVFRPKSEPAATPKEDPQPVFRLKSEAELVAEMKTKEAQREAQPGEPAPRFDP